MNAVRNLLACLFIMYSAISVQATVRYVDLNSASPASPYTDWSTAATNIQAAIDAAVDGDLVLVTNGVYATGGRVVYGSLTNRVVVDKALTVQSVNGPAETVIEGYTPPGGYGDSAVRCIYMTNSATLMGLTLTDGGTRDSGDSFKEQSGGGVWCESRSCIVSNCSISFNTARFYGGGVYSGTLTNCDLIQNVSYANGGGSYLSLLNGCRIAYNFSRDAGGTYNANCNGCLVLSNTAVACSGGCGGGGSGGGALGGTLNNCTIVGNQGRPGGVGGATVYNCIIYYNGSSIFSDANVGSGTFNYCCTIPAPPPGSGSWLNFSTPPAFVNPSGGDFRLQSTSPCINSGRNAFAPGATDLDGNPRIVGFSVDVGAYEFQWPTSVLSYHWAQVYGLPVDGSADYLDPDGDGLNNWQEWMAATSPTSAASVLKIISITKYSFGVNVAWQLGPPIPFFVERSTNLTAQPAFSVIKTNILGSSFTDTTATNAGPYYYRVGVQ